jgi:hypothetical protein
MTKILTTNLKLQISLIEVQLDSISFSLVFYKIVAMWNKRIDLNLLYRVIKVLPPERLTLLKN